MTKESRVPKARAALRSSSDTSRIAANLVNWPLSSASSNDVQGARSASNHLQAVEAAIRARALRPNHVPSELLLDPAWDMLLQLYRAEIAGEVATASALSRSAGVTTSSGLRWIDALVAKGLCIRGDRADEGRMSVELSWRGSEALQAYFAQLEG